MEVDFRGASIFLHNQTDQSTLVRSFKGTDFRAPGSINSISLSFLRSYFLLEKGKIRNK